MKEIKIKLSKKDLSSLVNALGDEHGLAQRTLNNMQSRPENYTFDFKGADSYKVVLQDQKDYIKRLNSLWRKFSFQRRKLYPKKK